MKDAIAIADECIEMLGDCPFPKIPEQIITASVEESEHQYGGSDETSAENHESDRKPCKNERSWQLNSENENAPCEKNRQESRSSKMKYHVFVCLLDSAPKRLAWSAKQLEFLRRAFLPAPDPPNIESSYHHHEENEIGLECVEHPGGDLLS
jgi:hypothetical protein